MPLGNASVPVTRITTETLTMQVDDNKEKTPRFTNSTLFLQKQGLSKGGQVTNVKVQTSARTVNVGRLKTGMLVRTGQKRPHGILLKPGTQTIRRPYSPEKKHLNSSQIRAKGEIVVPPSNNSRTWYPLRPRNPNVDSASPVSSGKLLALTMKETGSQEGKTETNFRTESVKTPGHASPSSTFQKQIATPSATPQPFTNVIESTEEPTITTEKNITAYINGTKCVRKVLVGYKKIHGNMSDGNALTKNLTVIVGHLNGTDFLHKLLIDGSTVNAMITGPDAETSEARRSVKEQEGEEEIYKETVEKNANVINATPLLTRQLETTLYQPLTTTSAPPSLHNHHLPTPQSLAQPERVNQHTAERPPRKNSMRAFSLSIPRQPTRSKAPSLASPPIVGRPLFKSNSSSSSLKTQKHKQTSWPNPITSRSAKETHVEKKVLNSNPSARQFQDSTPELAHKSKTETSTPLPVKLPMKKVTATKITGVEESDRMPYRRTPFRGSYTRRPFQNRTRPILESPQHPYERPVRRLFPSKPIFGNNKTINQGGPIQPVDTTLTPAKENGTTIKIRPNAILNRTNGSSNRHSQIKHVGNTRVGPNISQYGKGNSDISSSTDHPMENDNSAQEHVLSETDGSIEHVGVNNVTSTGFLLIWGAPKGKFKHFIITQSELGPENKDKDEMNNESEEKEQDVDDEKGLTSTAVKKSSLNKGKGRVYELVPNVQSTKMNKSGENISSFTTILPGTARSHQMVNLSPQTRYSVSVFGKGPTFRSKTHNLIVHTGTQNQKSVFLNLNLSIQLCKWSEYLF